MLDRTPSSRESAKRFVIAFFSSLGGMLLAAIIFVILENRFIFNWRGQLAEAVLIFIEIAFGLWFLRKGEKHTAMGIFFGLGFGIVFGLLVIILIGLFLTTYPAN